jgi:hypothetical protein
MPVVVLFILLAAVVGSSALVFALTYLYMRGQNDRLTGGRGPAFDTLQEQVRRLTDELDGANAQIEGLRERMDFTERLLGDGRVEGPRGSDDPG